MAAPIEYNYKDSQVWCLYCKYPLQGFCDRCNFKGLFYDNQGMLLQEMERLTRQLENFPPSAPKGGIIEINRCEQGMHSSTLVDGASFVKRYPELAGRVAEFLNVRGRYVIFSVVCKKQFLVLFRPVPQGYI
jgi:hypothetical protein